MIKTNFRKQIFITNCKMHQEHFLTVNLLHGITFQLSKYMYNQQLHVMGIKPGPKRTAKSTGKPDKRQRDNKDTPGNNTPSLKPHKHKKGD